MMLMPAVWLNSSNCVFTKYGGDVLGDELLFEEMINAIAPEITEVDIILETGGGLSTTVAKLVERLRARFDHVGFIILNKAMSAGTMFAVSGDEIIMTSSILNRNNRSAGKTNQWNFFTGTIDFELNRGSKT